MNLSNLADGDVVELRVKYKVLAAGSAITQLLQSFSNAQGVPGAASVPFTIETNCALDCSLKQVAGTGRSFEWALVSI